ncbi:MAG: rhodanese-like domain-containing protein [Gemmatimonadota bacterium]|nr:rhodanese-like domain-containing protein [Gemmatimonadota bacterium]
MDTVTTEEMERMLEDPDTLVINVLDEEQFERAHLPESESVPLSEPDFVDRVEALVQDKDTPVVVYCAGPDCDASPRAAKMLTRAGFARVFDYEGGMEAWIAAGNDVERAETASLH